MIAEIIAVIKTGLKEIPEIKDIKTVSDESELDRLVVEPSAAIVLSEIAAEKKGSVFNKAVSVNIFIKTRKPNDSEANQTTDYALLEAVFSFIESIQSDGYFCGVHDTADTHIIRKISFKTLTR